MIKRRKVRLGDYVDLLTGFPFKSAEYSIDGTGVRLLRGDNIGQGALRWESAKRWPERLVSDHLLYQLRQRDVVLAMDRPWIEAGLKYAAVGRSDLPCLLVQRVARLRALPGLEQIFLRYVIGDRTFTDHVLAVQTGTAVPHISGDQIRAFQFELPSIAEQRAIAEVLGALDDKIECNARIARTAQELASAVWTVTNSRWPAGAGHETTLGQLLDDGALYFSDGYRTKQSELGVPGVPVLRVADVFDGRVLLPSRDRILEALRVKFARKVARPGDVVLTTKGTIGRVAMVPGWMPEAVYSPQLCFFRVQSGSALDRYWLHGWFRGPEFRERAAAVQHQTDMAPYINLVDLRATRITLPPAEVQRHVGEVIGPLEDTAQAASHESATLASMRDTLLSRLLSGELRVRDAEALVGETV